MKKLIALVLLGFMLVLAGCSQQAPPQNGTAPPSPGSANKMVEIKFFAFNPAAVTVNKGMTVIWVNGDSAPHQILFSDGTKSQVLSNGMNYSRTFPDSGTFDYSCAIHPSMKGSVKVVGLSG